MLAGAADLGFSKLKYPEHPDLIGGNVVSRRGRRRTLATGSYIIAGGPEILKQVILRLLRLPILALVPSGLMFAQAEFRPAIPKTWDEAALREIEAPLARREASPRHVTSEFYYRIPTRPIYRSYTIYAPGHEPADYMDWLKQREPEVLWDYDVAGKQLHAPPLRTKEDWIRAGEMVFDAPLSADEFEVEALRDLQTYRRAGMPVAKDGTVPFQRYVIRKKGVVEVGDSSCAGCHTRLMPNGTVLKGAQGNNPFDRFEALEEELSIARNLSTAASVEQDRQRQVRRNWGVPWLVRDPHEDLYTRPLADLLGVLKAIPPGVQARTGTSNLYPAQIPDLIGVERRRFLDHTGLVRQRAIGDLMRYAALNQGMDRLSFFAGFQPASVDHDGKALSDPAHLPEAFFSERYSDEQLYALALFVYSLVPPENPNRRDASAARGETVFRSEGCAGCHTAPLYTNNKVTPAGDFQTPVSNDLKEDILPIRVGTDGRLALVSRRGTGYYKVPSLRGVWYRGPFEHNGSVATLQDWFDPRRLRDDYVPTGFVGYGVKMRPVRGHEFGLKLSAEDKAALISFLNTL